MRYHRDQVERVAQLPERIPLGPEGPDAAFQAVGIDHRGGEALEEIVGHDALPPEDATIDVLMERHEAGGEELAPGVDRLGGGGALEITDRGDPVAADAHISAEPGVAGAVQDPTSGDQDIEAGGGLRQERGDREAEDDPERAEQGHEHFQEMGAGKTYEASGHRARPRRRLAPAGRGTNFQRPVPTVLPASDPPYTKSCRAYGPEAVILISC